MTGLQKLAYKSCYAILSSNISIKLFISLFFLELVIFFVGLVNLFFLSGNFFYLWIILSILNKICTVYHTSML